MKILFNDIKVLEIIVNYWYNDTCNYLILSQKFGGAFFGRRSKNTPQSLKVTRAIFLLLTFLLYHSSTAWMDSMLAISSIDFESSASGFQTNGILKISRWFFSKKIDAFNLSKLLWYEIEQCLFSKNVMAYLLK